MRDYKEELLVEFEKMNEILKDNAMKLELVVVGTASLVLRNLINREIKVVDTLVPVNDYVEEWIKDFIKINSEVAAFDSSFGNWEKDTEVIIKFSNIKIKTLSIERLIAAHIFNDRHYDDVMAAAVNSMMDQYTFEEAYMNIKETIDPVIDFSYKNKKLIEAVYKFNKWDFKKSILFQFFRDKDNSLD